MVYIKKRDRDDFGFGPNIKGKHKHSRQVFATRYSRGQPKENYITDYFEDAMSIPKEVHERIRSMYMIWDHDNNQNYRARARKTIIWKTLSRAKSIVTLANKHLDCVRNLEVYEVRLIPVQPTQQPLKNIVLPRVPLELLKDIKEPIALPKGEFHKPDTEDPTKGFVARGKERAKIKRKKDISILEDEYNKQVEITDEILKSMPPLEDDIKREKQKVLDAEYMENKLKEQAQKDKEELIKSLEESTENTERAEREERAEMSTGFTCSKCGTDHKFISWLYAHWYEKTKHICAVCNNITWLLEGKEIGYKTE